MKGWRTMLVALGFVTVGTVLLVFTEQTEAGLSLIAGGTSMAGLRAVTTTKMGRPE